MPLTWKELEKAGPIDFRMDNVPRLLARRGDIWADIGRRKQKLEKILAKNA
jgi:DNA primase